MSTVNILKKALDCSVLIHFIPLMFTMYVLWLISFCHLIIRKNTVAVSVALSVVFFPQTPAQMKLT